MTKKKIASKKAKKHIRATNRFQAFGQAFGRYVWATIARPSFVLTLLALTVCAFILFIASHSEAVGPSLAFLMMSLTVFAAAVANEVISRRRWEEVLTNRHAKLERKLGHLEEQLIQTEDEKERLKHKFVSLVESLSQDASVRKQRELQDMIHDLGVVEGALATTSEADFDARAYQSMTERIMRNNAREKEEEILDVQVADVTGPSQNMSSGAKAYNQAYPLPDFDESFLNEEAQTSSHLRTITRQAYESLAEEKQESLTRQSLREQDPSFSEDVVTEMINSAVRQDRVDIFMQPVVRLPQRKVKYYEVFARLRAEKNNFIPAKRYLTKAREERLMPAIDNLVLLRAVQFMRKERGRIENLEPFFFNLNFETLTHSSFMADLVEFLNDNPQLTPRFILEMRQDDYDKMSDHAWTIMESLGDLGCRFSLDGVSDFNIDIDKLRERKIRFIKIDANLLLDSVSSRIGETAFYNFKKELDHSHIQLIVQKIEDEDMLLDILDYDIDLGQGYLFGKPVHSKEREAA